MKSYKHIILAIFLIFTLTIALNGINAVESKNPQVKLLGKNKLGYVELIGPIGNKCSKVKIAYVIGIHPLEKKSHMALYKKLIAKSKKLKRQYYIYRVVVTKDPDNYSKGRMNGQLLAQKYILPKIKRSHFNLVIDVHGNTGNAAAGYGAKNFLFAPLNNTPSKKIAKLIIKKMNVLKYNFPPSQTSPKYLTIPLVKAHIKTIIYETYLNQSQSKLNHLAKRFITVVDKLKL